MKSVRSYGLEAVAAALFLVGVCMFAWLGGLVGSASGPAASNGSTALEVWLGRVPAVRPQMPDAKAPAAVGRDPRAHEDRIEVPLDDDVPLPDGKKP